MYEGDTFAEHCSMQRWILSRAHNYVLDYTYYSSTKRGTKPDSSTSKSSIYYHSMYNKFEVKRFCWFCVNIKITRNENNHVN